MSDRELLELAAKAADISAVRVDTEYENCFKVPYYKPNSTGWREWNPLTDDGDALRLAIKLGLTVDCKFGSAYGEHLAEEVYGEIEDIAPCVRRAIVLAAAEIGRAMP